MLVSPNRGQDRMVLNMPLVLASRDILAYLMVFSCSNEMHTCAVHMWQIWKEITKVANQTEMVTACLHFAVMYVFQSMADCS